MAKTIKNRKEYKPNGYWTKERCIAEAKKYKYYRNWRKKSEASLQAARRKGWYLEIKNKYLKDNTRFLSKEDFFKQAKKYNKRKDFMRKSSGAYNKALKNGWLDECCSHMMTTKEVREKRCKWTRTSILKTAKKFKRWAEFINTHKGVYDALCRLDMVKEVQKMMIVGNSDLSWTYEELKELALKYKNKLEFTEFNEGALKAIYDRGLKDELLSHMPSFEDQMTKWTETKIIEAILECDRSKKQLYQRFPGAYYRFKQEPNKYSFLFEKQNSNIEIFLLHPKIIRLFIKNKVNVFYESRFEFKKEYIIPDFVCIKNDIVYVFEAKTEGSYYSNFSKKELENQIKKQKTIMNKLYKNKQVVNIVVSEFGTIQSKVADYNFSLKDLNKWLKSGVLLNCQPLNKSKIDIIQQINQEYKMKFKNLHRACANPHGC